MWERKNTHRKQMNVKSQVDIVRWNGLPWIFGVVLICQWSCISITITPKKRVNLCCLLRFFYRVIFDFLFYLYLYMNWRTVYSVDLVVFFFCLDFDYIWRFCVFSLLADFERRNVVVALWGSFCDNHKNYVMHRP